MSAGGLQLKRRPGEYFYLYVGDVEIIIEVRDIKGNTAKIGIIAPKDEVEVVRGEVMEAECE